MMPQRRKYDPLHYCRACGIQMHRKVFNGRLEDRTVFLRSVYCGRECMAEGQRREEVTRAAHLCRVRSLKKDNCEMCGGTVRLQLHHRDCDWTNDDPANIVTLCASCHMKLHWSEPGRLHQPDPPPPCKVCGQQSRKLGMCQKHYQRWKKYGDPLLTKRSIGGQFTLVRVGTCE